MMIPLKAELRLSTKPVVTYVIVLLCIIVYALQYNNKNAIQKSASAYCSGLNNFQRNVNELDFLSSDPYGCVRWISHYYSLADKDHVPYFFKSDYDDFSQYSSIFTSEKYYATLRIFQNHIESFTEYAPINLDGALVYDPSTLNLFTMVTSVLSHGSFLHLFFNLVFFLAFAPALEALIGDWKKFIGVVFVMILGTNLVYAMAMGSADYPTPTLGLSGIVSGMIGFAASFMPKARIRTFYYVMVIPTPVWLLALYYIGWDMYDLFSRTDHGGVNLVVHVAGGVIGVLMMMLFRERHKEISEELQEEITFMNKQRTSLVDSYQSSRETSLQKSVEENKKKESHFLEQLHRLARVHNHTAIISMIFKDYDPAHSTIERFEFLFEELKKWNEGRSYECVGRFIINQHLTQHHSGAALKTAKLMHDTAGSVLLADPGHVLILAQAAKETHDYELSYAIVHDADNRYFGECKIEMFLLLEIELLHLYLNKSPEALKLLKSIFDQSSHPHRVKVVEYSKKIGLIGNV